MLNCNGKRIAVFIVIAPASNSGHEKLLVLSSFYSIFTNKLGNVIDKGRNIFVFLFGG